MQYRLSDFTWGQKRREREEGNSSVVYKVVRKLDNVLCALKIIRYGIMLFLLFYFYNCLL